nr:hypothetical protein Iba_chr05eCG13630 [Ipomoea batatas]
MIGGSGGSWISMAALATVGVKRRRGGEWRSGSGDIWRKRRREEKEERCPRENNSLLKTQPAMAMDMNMIELLEEEGIKAMEKASRHVGDEDIKAERPEEEHGDGEENDNGDTEEEVPAEEDPCHL